jgi:hypothetical protein
LHGSDPEIGLLELQRFLIKARRSLGQAATIYDICEPRTEETMGLVRTTSGSLPKFLRRFLREKFLTTKLEVCETKDESLVFSVLRTTGFWRERIDVYDADDHVVGYGLRLAGRGGFWMYDQRNLPFAELRGVFQDGNCCFLATNGQELGTVTNERTTPSTQGLALVSIDEELSEQPLAKMLLLGAALALKIPHCS